MKNFTLLFLAALAVITMLYAGVDGLTKDYSYGPFITFVGVCTAAGLAIDLYNMISLRVRKSNVRKLGRF